MINVRPIVLLAVLCAASCDSPLASRQAVGEVEVNPGYVHLPIGQTAQLDAVARSPSGARLNGRVEFHWTSSDSSVVAVSSAGRATARRAGVATIAARAGGVRGAAEVSVAVPLLERCTSELRLAVGEVYTAAPGDGALLCFAAGGSGAEFTLIPFYAPAGAEAAIPLEIAVSGSQDLVEPGHADSVAAPPAAAPAVPIARDRHGEWELALRKREHRELGPRLAAARPPAAAAAAAASTPAVGTRLSLNVNPVHACSLPDRRTGEVVAVSARAVVVADLENPAGGFTAAEYAEFARAFDELVYPVVTNHFGTPSDLDGNGRVLLFFTRAVNEMGSGSGGVGGFFFSRDLLPRSGAAPDQGCEGSNHAEILYLMVPDPTQPSLAKPNVQRNVVGVMAHELQHLVNASQRLFVTRSPRFEETWLNEGLSHIAEELVGHRAAGIGPRENLEYARLRESPAAWESFTTFHRRNFDRLAEHLAQPTAPALFDAAASRPGRGAAWQFLRYAADRRGREEERLWRSVVASQATGLRNLERAFGVEIALWIRDWAIAVYVDDALPDLDPVWTQPSWNFRSVFGGLRGDGSYPLAARQLSAAASTRVEVAAGGAAYLRFGVPPHGRAEVRTSWNGGLTPPHRVFVSAVRTR